MAGHLNQRVLLCLNIGQGCSEAGSRAGMKSLKFLVTDSAVPFSVSQKWYQWFKIISYVVFFFKHTHALDKLIFWS